MYGNNFMLDRLTKQKEDIDNLIQNYKNMAQQTPVNNYINTNQMPTNVYELKKLNDGDEVENILINNDCIFIGTDRMQIKRLDGTIEKYSITKIYPVDQKDEQIKELNKKVEELERRLNNEHTEYVKPNDEINKSNANANEHIKSKSTTTSK